MCSFFNFDSGKIKLPISKHKTAFFLKSKSQKKRHKKKGKLLKSQCSTLYPCCVPTLGEFEGSDLSKTCPAQRYNTLVFVLIKLMNIKQIIGIKKSLRKTKGFNIISKWIAIKALLNYDEYLLISQ